MFIAAVAVVLLLVQPFPVLHDYPEWMYQGHIAWSLLTDKTTYTGLFELVPVPVPNAVSQSAIALLNSVVSPVAAGKIWLAVYFVLALFTGIYAMRSSRYSGSMQLIFTLSIVFGPGFWNGYINFQFGLLFFALYILCRQRGAAAVLLFSLLIYFSHASVFAGFVCFVIVSECLLLRRMRVFAALLPALGLLFWYSIVRLSAGGGQNEGVGSLFQWAQYKLYTLAKQGPFHNFIQADGESLLASLHGLYLAGFAINFLIAVIIGLWLLVCAVNIARRRQVALTADATANGTAANGTAASGTDNLVPVVITITALLAGWLLAGKNTFGVVNLGERFLIVALMLAMLHLQCPNFIRKIWASLCVVAGVYTVCCLVVLSKATDIYSVSRSAEASELESYVDDIYKNSRHKYFNHRIFIYANLGQYLIDPDGFSGPPPVDHESSIVRVPAVASDMTGE